MCLLLVDLILKCFALCLKSFQEKEVFNCIGFCFNHLHILCPCDDLCYTLPNSYLPHHYFPFWGQRKTPVVNHRNVNFTVIKKDASKSFNCRHLHNKFFLSAFRESVVVFHKDTWVQKWIIFLKEVVWNCITFSPAFCTALLSLLHLLSS